ncbi:MAG: hypothetical protein J6W64_03015 [Bacilli bacterium]|nr:hypothetical protein [Bacilli bacterium]
MVNFREYLAEEAKDNLVHYTTLNNLKLILQAGRLRGGTYECNLDTLRSGKVDSNRNEICLTRKSNTKNIHHYAVRRNEVMIMFDIDNIINIRGVKKPYTINEPQTRRYMFMRKNIDSVLNKFDIPAGLKRQLKALLENGKLNYNFFKNNGVIDEDYLKRCIYSKVRKMMKPYNAFERASNKAQSDLSFICRVAGAIMYYKYYKEGEERIVIPKEGIPVSTKYMKIIIDSAKEYMILNSLNELIDEYNKKDPGIIEFKKLPKSTY